MTKATSDALFDYWQVTVSVDFARMQYLFELLDEEGQGVLYGDKGCVEHTQEKLGLLKAMALSFLIFTKLTVCQVPSWVSNTVWYQIFPERFATGNPNLTPNAAREWDAAITPNRDDFLVEIYKGLSTI